MDDAAREAMLGERIDRLIVWQEFSEAAELLREYCALRRKQGKIVPPEDRRSVCDDCPDRDGCEDARVLECEEGGQCE